MEPTKRIIAPDSPGRDDIEEMLEATILKVFDGDGFLADIWHPLDGKSTHRVPFRFAFIDAPEMQQPFGNEAKEFLQKTIVGKTLRLDLIGKQSTGGAPIDSYKRLLCMAYLTEDIQIGEVEYFMNGKCDVGVVKTARPVKRNVELEMIINGMAWVVEQYAFDREQEYFAAQEDAWRNRRGIWTMDDPEPPWEFKQKQKRRRKATGRQPSLFLAPCQDEGCDGRLVERMGSRGPFLGCSNFPRCRFTRSP